MKNKNESGFAHLPSILIIIVVFVAIFMVFKFVKHHSDASKSAQTTPNMAKPVEKAAKAEVKPEVSWNRGEGGVWVPSSTPPACPREPIMATPVDMSLVTSILYPGQVRGNAFKPHGGFRFDNQPSNDITVKVPMDAKLVRGSKGLFPENGEVQYGFEFIAPCGIWYAFGHIHTLSPQFQAYADKLPLVSQPGVQQMRDITPAPNVKKGDVIATQVGIIHTKNVFVEWQVNDIRHKNGKSIRPSWSQYSNEFDDYAVCWLDMLPAKDTALARSLPGGDSVSGKQSDYCQ